MSDGPSAEQLDAARARLSSVVFPGLEARIQIEVTGGPEDDLRLGAILQGGHVTELAPGSVDDADVTLTMAAVDARALVEGQLEPSVAFMQGRMKVVGSMQLMLELLSFASTPTWRAARERLTGLADPAASSG